MADTDFDQLSSYKKMFDEARSGLENPRMKATQARDYYDGEQLTTKQRNVLKRRKQPETVRNRIGPAVNGILGLLEQNKVDPKGLPRNPQDEDAADVASKVLRYVADKNRFHKIKLDCADNHLVEGASAVVVEVDGEDIKINRIRFEEFFYDPYSREADYSDARYLGIGKWMYADDVARMYPEHAEDVLSLMNNNAVVMAGDMTWDDKPDSIIPWIDRKGRRLMVVEMYHRDGEWRRCVFCAGVVLEEGVSPYNDDAGQPMNPIEGSTCFMDRNLERYGVVRWMISLQDELNARASRALHLLNSRQLTVTDPNFPPDVDSETARLEAAKADGVLPTGYSVVPTTDMAQGNLAVMQEVSQSIDRLAPTPAVLGRSEGSSQSGRSRLVLQQAGMTEIARPLGRFEDWENRVYRQVWLRAKQFWTDEKWIRVTDDEGAPEFVQINAPIYAREPLLDPTTGQPIIDPQSGEPQTEVLMVPQPVMGPDGQPQVDPNTGQPVMQPQPILMGYDNRLAEIDMDIVVETVPDTANLAVEQFQTLSQLAQAYGPEKVPFDVLLQLSSLPDKRKVREMLEGDEQQKAQQAQMQQMQAQMQQMAAQLGMQKLEAEIVETQTQAKWNDARARKEEADIIVDAAEMTQKALNPLGQMG